jgi:hypothetical protein
VRVFIDLQFTPNHTDAKTGFTWLRPVWYSFSSGLLTTCYRDEMAYISGTDDYKFKLEKLETELKELRAKYDLYFNGIERIPPQKFHDDFDRSMRRLSTVRSHNTGLRFRFQNLQASYITTKQYWTRMIRQLEDGTSRRDKFRVKLRYGDTKAGPVGKGSDGAAKEEKAAVPVSEDSVYSFADEPTKPKPKPDPHRQVYENYIKAKKMAGENATVSYEKLKASLEKQREAIKKKYNARDVQFKVVVEGGKAKIKAVPKK